MTELVYPFSAIVGQDRLKQALIYSLIVPEICGVLISGEKGTGKSTVVRGLAELSEKKVIELPLNVTEDMLVGSIDFEAAVSEGSIVCTDSVLSRADGNLLYIDEVNLLADSIVSTLVSAAASGQNIVERDGISCLQSCRFSLIGTMNPEEGTLRPQFLDKFGLYVEVCGERDLQSRCEIIRRRMEYERDPELFREKWESETDKLRERLATAVRLADEAVVDDSVLTLASEYAVQAKTQGNRCELLLVRTAVAAAAWNGRRYVSTDDLREAASYVLPHRMDADARLPEEKQEKNKPSSSEDETTKDRQPDGDKSSEGMKPLVSQPNSSPDMTDTGAETVDDLVEARRLGVVSLMPERKRDRQYRKGCGKRSKTKSSLDKGRYSAYTSSKNERSHSLALVATLCAAAPYQSSRDHKECKITLTDRDLRYKTYEDRTGATIVFVVDASGSMGAKKRMIAVKETILAILTDSYQKRDKVGLIAFRKNQAQTLLNITGSVEMANRQLQAMPTGGNTPLADGLFAAWQMLNARRLKDPDMLPILVLVTDGRANSPLWTKDPVADSMQAARMIRQEGIQCVVIDTENDFISLGLAKKIGSIMDAAYYKCGDINIKSIKTAVNECRPSV